MSGAPMTVAGERMLRDELDDLKRVARPNIVKEIAEARSHGDLRENAEFHAAKERQTFIEGRIRQIEARLANAQVIDVTRLAPTGRVIFGATVTLSDGESGATVRYQIVGEDESDVAGGKISVMSPIARALIGKAEDDAVSVATPNGEREYVVEKVEHL